MIKLLVENTLSFVKYGVVSNNEVIFLDIIDKRNDKIKVGEIYLGVVENYIPGLEAAFIDLGVEKGFLQTKKKYNKGQKLLVQVSKESFGQKKVKLTEDISISGVYSVFLKNESKVKIPRGTLESNNLVELKNKLEENFKGVGILLRSAGLEASYEDISKELQSIIEDYNSFLMLNTEAKLLYSPFSMDMQIKKLAYKYRVDEIVVNDESYFKTKKIEFIKSGFQLSIAQNLTFDYNGINIDNYLHNYFKFTNFGLYLDKTEALTVFDIDSGFNNSNQLKNNHSLSINKQAVVEILKLITLLNIGGIIVVDLISLDESQKQEMNDFVAESLGHYRKDISSSPISKGWLLELTRRKTGLSIIEKLTVDCFHCKGSGKIYSDEYLLDNFEIQLRNFITNYNSKEVSVLIPVNCRDRDFIQNELSKIVKEYSIYANFEFSKDINQKHILVRLKSNI